MKTQVAYSDQLNKGKYAALQQQAKRLGKVRSEVWQRFGSINGIGLGDRTIRDQWIKQKRIFNVPANAWKQTLADAIGNIKANREASKVKVKQCIRRHTNDTSQQKILFTALKSDKWTDIKYLKRLMRKLWKRGRNHTTNQINVRSDDYTVFWLNDRLWIKISSLIKGKRIAIPLTTDIVPSGNLRIILRNNRVEIHYAVEEEKTNDCGIETLGVDKGYTEVLTDSNGVHYGNKLGALLTKESNRLKVKNQRRNRLRKIAGTKPWVNEYNLGRQKYTNQSIRHQQQVKTEVYTAVNSLIDKASVIVTEDLTSVIAGKKFGKDVSRRLSSWTKGVIAQAIERVSSRRGSSVIYVNAAYTSQMDSQDGTLTGIRRGDHFYRENGEVVQADVNAARNVLARSTDTEINLWTPFQRVKEILLKRTESLRLRLPNLDSSYSLI